MENVIGFSVSLAPSSLSLGAYMQVILLTEKLFQLFIAEGGKESSIQSSASLLKHI